MTSIPPLDVEARLGRLEQAVYDIQQTLERSSSPRARAGETTESLAPRVEIAPPPRRSHAQSTTPEFPSPEWLAARSAEWWLGSLGVVFLVIASFLLYRYAVDHEWITPLVRVLTGVVVGGGMFA